MFRGDRRLMGGGLVEERHRAMMGGEVRGEERKGDGNGVWALRCLGQNEMGSGFWVLWDGNRPNKMNLK